MPISLKFFASLSVTVSGYRQLAASPASEPKVAWRLLAGWCTTPRSTVSSPTGTPHRMDADVSSIARALPPASRS